MTTAEGLTVVHLFAKRTAAADNDAIVASVEAAQAAGVQVVSVAVLGTRLNSASWRFIVRAGRCVTCRPPS